MKKSLLPLTFGVMSLSIIGVMVWRNPDLPAGDLAMLFTAAGVVIALSRKA